MAKTVADVLALGKSVKMVDLRFTDLLGLWHHFTMPVQELSAQSLDDLWPPNGITQTEHQQRNHADKRRTKQRIEDPATADFARAGVLPGRSEEGTPNAALKERPVSHVDGELMRHHRNAKREEGERARRSPEVQFFAENRQY